MKHNKYAVHIDLFNLITLFLKQYLFHNKINIRLKCRLNSYSFMGPSAHTLGLG